MPNTFHMYYVEDMEHNNDMLQAESPAKAAEWFANDLYGQGYCRTVLDGGDENPFFAVYDNDGELCNHIQVRELVFKHPVPADQPHPVKSGGLELSFEA